MDYAWKPIELWNQPLHRWSGANLPKAWNLVQKVFGPDRGQVWRKRMAREWSIETGQIERAFEIDRGAAVAMLRDGYSAALVGKQANGLSEERVVAILEDTEAVLAGLFAFVKGERAPPGAKGVAERGLQERTEQPLPDGRFAARILPAAASGCGDGPAGGPVF